MPEFSINPDDTPFYASNNGATLPEGSVLVGYSPTDGPVYEATLRQAFNFLRRHDSGRYSSRMKMRVLQMAEEVEAARERGSTAVAGTPVVLALNQPFRFDEDTEVKSGGLIGVVVMWPSESGRVILAVHADYRRKHLGRTLLSVLRNQGTSVQLTSWVNKYNHVGQHFLLSTGFTPTGFNQSGGVCWTLGEDTSEEGVEDGLDPLAQPTSSRRFRYEESQDDDDSYPDGGDY